MPKLPTIIEETHITKQEGARAQFWRKNRAHMDVQQLADVTGYSPQAIYLMEKGVTSTGAPVKTWAWQRYKMACAGVELYLQTTAAGEAKLFDWGRR
jgi:hypothetical protein